jgi:hypothetical protein
VLFTLRTFVYPFTLREWVNEEFSLFCPVIPPLPTGGRIPTPRTQQVVHVGLGCKAAAGLRGRGMKVMGLEKLIIRSGRVAVRGRSRQTL